VKAYAAALLEAALLCGCGSVAGEGVSARDEALYAAAPSGPEDDAVVKLRALKNDGDTLWCTATLIAPNLVLTAMHCVAMVADSANCTAEGELAPGSLDGTFGEPFVPSNITLHVGAGEEEPAVALGEKIFTSGALTVCKDDLALVALDRELKDVPIAALRLGVGNQRGEPLRVVGFGKTETGSTGVRRARDDLVVQLLGQSVYANSSDPIPANTFATIGVSVCNGDSGGPAFTRNDAVTGVVSHGASCESPTARHLFTQVAPYEERLLRPAFDYVGQKPILETRDASGDGGQPGDELASGGTGDGGASEDGAGVGAAGHGANAGAARVPAPQKGGCACSSSAAGSSGWFASLAAVSALGVGRLRRRRAKPRANRLPGPKIALLGE